MTASRVCRWMAALQRAGVVLLVALGTVGGTSGPAVGSCNVVASTERLFPSTLGMVTTPFARPGDLVSIRTPTPVFSAVGTQNTVTLRFGAPGAAPIAVRQVAAASPAPATPCPPERCDAGRCTCVQFAFPDTDDAVGLPGDGAGLTGPVAITVETGGATVATIDRLVLPGTAVADPTFRTFVALPPANDFAALTVAPGPAYGAVDADGNLLVPLDFRSLVPDGTQRTRFVDAETPDLPSVTGERLEVYTIGGQRLPPLVRPVPGAAIVGTIDAPESVLRVQGAGVPPPSDGGRAIIGDVTATADPKKRAVALNLLTEGRFAVYENWECNPTVEPTGECMDLNGDGDQTDHFLMALDLDVARATPVTIDTFQGEEFAARPQCLSGYALYNFQASGNAVAFTLSESPWGEICRDANGNGIPDEVLHSGAYDLRRDHRIDAADGTPRNEAVGDTLAFSVSVLQPDGQSVDELHYYDARPEAADPGPHRVTDPAGDPIPVTRVWPEPFGSQIALAGNLKLPVLRSIPADMAVADARIAFTAAAGPGTLQLLDTRNPNAVTDTGQLAGPFFYMGRRWIAFRTTRTAPDGDERISAAFLDVSDPLAPPRYACERPGGRAEPGPVGDGFVSCTLHEQSPYDSVDLDGDGDEADAFLHIAWPDGAGGMDERSVATNVFAYNLVVGGDVAAVALSEDAERRDLDGDGVVGPGVSVLHLVNGRTRRILNLQQRVYGNWAPFIRFIDRGLSFLTPELTRTVLRDVDGDGSFEEQAVDVATGERRLADDCPSVANPDQADADGDGTGDACDPGLPGASRPGEECLLQVHVAGATPSGAAGEVQCRDGDSCDLDHETGRCTFRVAACVLVDDARHPTCAAARTPLSRLSVAVVVPHDPLGGRAARDAVAGALASLPGAVRRGARLRWKPPLAVPAGGAPPACGAAAAVVVPAAGPAGRATLKLRGRTAAVPGLRPASPRSALSLVCLPR